MLFFGYVDMKTKLRVYKLFDLNIRAAFVLITGESMVGQSILLHAATGDEIRLYNFGGDIYEDETTPREDFLHFIGVLLHSSDRS